MRLNPSITPRRWQSEALEVWAKELRGIVRVVTGGGKTVFSYLCLQKFFEEYPDGRAVIVVPTLALLDQWFVDICDATDLEETEVACFSGDFQAEGPRRVNIVVLNTGRRLARQLSEFGPSILVVDECHRSGAVQNSRALEGTHEATLGLSATPEREADGGFEARIMPSLGPIIYAYGYREAQTDGVIVDFNLINVEISTGGQILERIPILGERQGLGEKEERLWEEEGSLGDGATKLLVRSAESSLRIPWAAKLALAHRNERVIIFHERVVALGNISAILAHFDQNAVAYHSHLSESHRRDNLRLFRRGVVNVLVTCRALDEGANVPEANVAIVAHSTRSTRQRIQRLGRVLRPAPGKLHSLVYTLFAGQDQRTRLAREATAMEGVSQVMWRRGALQ